MKRVTTISYRIAGLHLALNFPAELNRRQILPSFESFVDEYAGEQTNVCFIELSNGESPVNEDAGKLLSDVSAVWGERFRFYEFEDRYLTTIRSEKTDGLWKMISNKEFSRSAIHLLNGEQSISHVLSWLIMVAFGQACLGHRAVLIHASVIALGGRGYVFLGKSGTGKSTQSRLWLEHVEGAELLNDDNPAIRLEDDGQVYVYGTPWSGKTACYKSMKVQMQAFVRLRQAAYNEMSWKKGRAALVSILPSCTALRWNRGLFAEMTDTVEAIIQKVPVTELECLPNRDAARLCYRELTI